MLKYFKVNSISSFFLGYLILMLVLWVSIQLIGSTDLPINYMYSFALNTLAFLGGVSGVLVSRHWGGAKSAVGRGLLFISIGLITWGAIGGYIWSYYNFVLQQEVPYPSFSDIGFITAIPLWAIGMFHMARTTGAKYGLRSVKGKAYLIFLPILSFLVSYFLLVIIARGGAITDGGTPLKVFFDFAYPIGDVIIITIALLIYGLTVKLLGGLYKWPIRILLFGFVMMFFGDMAFSYSTTVETYFNGNYADLLFTLALFSMSFGIASFDTKELK